MKLGKALYGAATAVNSTIGRGGTAVGHVADETLGLVGKGVGKTLDGASYAAGAVAGAAGRGVGNVAIGTAAFAGGVVYYTGKGLYKGAKAALTNRVSKWAAKKTLTGTQKGVSAVTKELARGALYGAVNGTGNNFVGKMANPIGMTAAIGRKVLGGLVKMDKGGAEWDAAAKRMVNKSPSLSLTNKGKAMVLGGSVLSGSVGAFSEAEARTMGVIDAQVTTATPDYQPQEYKKTVSAANDMAGATGDLVFALFKNRGRSMF